MPVVVVGNPFDLPKPAVDEAAITAMQGHSRGSAVRFIRAPAEIAHTGTGYAVVLLLNAGPDVGADFLCARRGAMSPPMVGGGTTLLAVFCGNADARSWAYSATGPVASHDDAQFHALVAQTTFLMIPPRDDDWSESAFF
jgi:hypothetical protein